MMINVLFKVLIVSKLFRTLCTLKTESIVLNGSVKSQLMGCCKGMIAYLTLKRFFMQMVQTKVNATSTGLLEGFSAWHTFGLSIVGCHAICVDFL